MANLTLVNLRKSRVFIKKGSTSMYTGLSGFYQYNLLQKLDLKQLCTVV